MLALLVAMTLHSDTHAFECKQKIVLAGLIRVNALAAIPLDIWLWFCAART